MKYTLTAGLMSILLSMVVLQANAADFEVTQKNKSFSTAELHVKVGDTVAFHNEDTVYHNIFSLSDAKVFDLGSFGPSEIRKVTFDKPGKIEVECAIHKKMKMIIDVDK